MLVLSHQLQDFRITSYFVMLVSMLAIIGTKLGYKTDSSFDFHFPSFQAGQRVLKQHGNTMDVSCIRFSNFGVIGLPYWFVCPLERVFNR